MTIPASKVRTLCSTAEAALVRASRKPELEQLTPAQLKRLANQAKKLSDKWADLGRTQSRARNRKVGFGDVDANTKLKAQIFSDALASLEAKLAKAEKSTVSATKTLKPKTKKDRNADHRSDRAAVRKGLAMIEDSIKSRAKKKKKK